MMRQSDYSNPGRAFIKRFGVPKNRQDLDCYVERYAAFLLEDAEALSLPVDLEKICWRYGIQWSSGTLPEGTDGFSDGHNGYILVNEDHAEVRQRFTHCHELVELLFAALQEAPVPEEVWHFLDGPTKEWLCNRGGAAILLPLGLFEDEAISSDVSLDAARSLGERFGASRIATLLALVERGPGLHALVAWRRKLKPTQERATSGGRQLGLGFGFDIVPQPLMRVEWVCTTRRADAPFIPKDKSVPDDSVIARTAAGELCPPCHEEIDIGKECLPCLVEALCAGTGRAEVISLLHLPGDDCGMYRTEASADNSPLWT